MEGVHENNDEALHLATVSKLVLIVKQLQILNYSLRKDKQQQQKKQLMSNDSECWIQYGGYILNKKHLQQIIIQGKELCDLHVKLFKAY